MRFHYLGVLLALPCSFVLAQDPVHRRLTVKDGLPSNAVYCAAQDRQGMLWFGTDAGVARFDGRHVDVLTVSDGLSDNDVFLIQQDSRERIWFLTGNGRPSYWLRGRMHNAGNDSALRKVAVPSGIFSFNEDGQGRVWFGGLNGELVSLDTAGHVTTCGVINPRTGQPGGHVTIAPGAGTQPLVFVGSEQVVFGRDGQCRLASSIVDPRGSAVRTDARAGHVVQADPHGVQLWKNGEWRKLLLDQDRHPVRSFLRAFPVSTGHMLVSLKEGGVRWFVPEGDRWSVHRPDQFVEDLVNDAVVDREGDHVICTAYGGVIIFSPAEAGTAYYAGLRKGKEGFLRLTTDPHRPGTVWCGTNQGDLYHLDDAWTLFDLEPKGPVFNRVNDLVLRSRDLWVALDHHVMQVDLSGDRNAQRHVLTLDTGHAEVPRHVGMKALALMPDGTVLGAYYGLYAEDHGAAVPLLRRHVLAGVPNVRIYAPHCDAANTLWFEEHGRLVHADGDGMRTVMAMAPNIRISDLASFGDTLVVATMGAGLRLVHGDREVGKVTVAQGLVSDRIRRISIFGTSILVATAGGAALVDMRAHPPAVRNITTDDGLPGNDVRDAAADAEHLYLLMPEGLCVLPRQPVQAHTSAPVPYVREIMVNESLVPADRPIVLRETDRLVLDLSAIHFAPPGAVHLEYMLGNSGQWHPTTGRVEFGGLGAGQGSVMLRAGVRNGPWSDPITVSFNVVPPFWRTWWFIALMLLVVAGLTFAGLRYMAYRRYHRRMAQLREQEARTEERQRIAMDLHDDLGAELSGLLLLTRAEQAKHPTPALERMENVTSVLCEKVYEVIWSSDPGSDTLEATLAFIDRHVADQCKAHALVYRHRHVALPEATLTAGQRRDLFLAVKEVVTNILKHAQAGKLTLQVRVIQGSLEIMLTDDGRGIPAEALRGNGNGLVNIQRRMAGIGGRSTIEPVWSGGTRVILTMPLDPLDRMADEGVLLSR